MNYRRREPDVLAVQWTGKNEEKDLINELDNIHEGKWGYFVKGGELVITNAAGDDWIICLNKGDWFVKENNRVSTYEDKEFQELFIKI